MDRHRTEVQDAEFQRVLKYCARWNVPVKLQELPPDYRGGDDWYAWFEGPVWGWIHWPSRTIWWPPRKNVERPFAASSDWACALLHELSHVLVEEDPNHAEEVTSEMLAFEYHSARFLKLSGWTQWMSTYNLDDNKEWPRFSTRQRGRYVQDSLIKAIAKGILTVDGKPTFRRSMGP